MRKRACLLIGLVVGSSSLAFVACGSDVPSAVFNPNADAGGQSADGSSGGLIGPGGFEGGFDDRPIDSLTVDPPTATLDLTAPPFATQKFTATAHYSDGTSGPAVVSWTASNAAVGSVDGSGLYTPRGTQGGVVTLTASAGGRTGTATLTVKLHQVDNPANADAATQASLLGATAADAGIVWTYPYDGMAYTRGLNAPELMWNGSAAGDLYAVHVESPTYELQAFASAKAVTSTDGTTPAGAAAFAFDPAQWDAFASSTSGDVKITVTRKHGTSFTRVVQQTWKMASRSMSGTIYYWAINKAAVVRIKPGATQPDFFLASATVPAPGEKNGSGVTTTQMFCPSCHTVSADGSTLAMGSGDWGGANVNDTWSTVYDLNGAKTTFHGYQTTDPATRFPLAALTPDGKVLVENWAQVRGNASGKDDSPIDLSAPSGTTAPTIAGTGLETLVGAGHHTFFPVFSADNALFAYVDSSTGDLFSLDWDSKQKKFSNKVKIAAAPGGGQKIAYPTISPDHRWIVYQVGPDFGSLKTTFLGDLFAVDTKNPQTPIALANINTTMSAAATTDRDQHRSYEPTFAPVASGGYFWIVFHSRRTYGNRLVGVPYVDGKEGSGTKQLWVAAIDVAGATASTADPSHPPFWLPGQDPSTRNMRGYWALDPCHADGASCAAGTDCCNGFCDTTNDAGAPVCGKGSSTCVQYGDKCEKDSDCCAGICINHVCSDLPPK